MTAVWQTVAHSSQSLGADPVCDIPTGTVDGHLMVAVGLCSAGQTISPPAGWTEHAASLSSAEKLWTRIASSEPANYTFNVTGTAGSVVVIARVTGFDTVTPIDVAAGVSVAGGTASVVIPSVSPSGADNLLLQFASRLTSTTFTPPGTATERWDAQPLAALQTTAGGDEIVGAGATGTRTWTSASSTGRAVGFMAAINPTPPAEGQFTGAYDFSGSGFIGQAGPGEGSFLGAYDFSGSGFNGVAPPPPPVSGTRWTPGGRDRFTARRTPKNRRRSR